MDKISCKIRLAEKKETADCIKMSRTSWPDWWRKNERSGKRHIAECVEAKRCLVAESDREIIAFVVWGNLWSKIHLQDIFVKEKYRRSGIGKSLIEKAIEIAKKNGHREIISDCDVGNKASVFFHLKNGFKKCGYIKNNWGSESSYVFSREIS